MNNLVGFVSLGCPKALVDSERIITQLKAKGYELTSSYQGAGVVVINTCGFIESAIEESLDTINQAMAENGKVIVTGCLGKHEALVRSHFKDVLHVSGAHAYEEVVKAVTTHLPIENKNFELLIPEEGYKLTPRHYAYLKISEGCNQKCSFCIIPSMRGRLQSYKIEQVLTEAKKLVKAGVKELLIISQDTSAYGVDVKYQEATWDGKPIQTDLYHLCKALGEMGIWVRLHYVYPYPNVDKIIPLMRDGLILPYLDIPLQHASPRILKAMRRPANQEKTLSRIKAWRELCPEIIIRSTFIVGFPGETDEDFNELLDFLHEAKLDRVGAFKYSPVEGAEANGLDDQVEESVKEDRLQAFMQCCETISQQKLKDKVGQEIEVLVDDIDDDGTLIARSKADAPEIDGQVFVLPHEGTLVGDLITVRVTDSDEHDLFAERC
jgi:ribosomal protein S12 methylthiotransferase